MPHSCEETSHALDQRSSLFIFCETRHRPAPDRQICQRPDLCEHLGESRAEGAFRVATLQLRCRGEKKEWTTGKRCGTSDLQHLELAAREARLRIEKWRKHSPATGEAILRLVQRHQTEALIGTTDFPQSSNLSKLLKRLGLAPRLPLNCHIRERGKEGCVSYQSWRSMCQISTLRMLQNHQLCGTSSR